MRPRTVEGMGTACSESPMAAAKGCEFDGESYSPGSASCQSGTQYRCDDGAWTSLALACTAGDAPADGARRADLRVQRRDGRDGIHHCKSGVTFRCDDGEWHNLGIACR